MSTGSVKPFLIMKNEQGDVRLTVRRPATTAKVIPGCWPRSSSRASPRWLPRAPMPPSSSEQNPASSQPSSASAAEERL